ncbi:MAG: PAS domain-containing protein, partial [Nevskiales bacterium]
EQFSDRMADYIALIHPEDRERVVRHYTRFVQEPVDEYEDEYRILGVDGMLRTVNVRARAERAANGRARSVSGILWDISEQIRQREALALMQERYRLATGAARVGVWIWNVAEREFEVDESLRTLFGLETHVNANDGRLRLGQDDFFMLIHPDDRPQHALYISSLLDTDTTEYFREFRIPLETGEVRDIQARGTIFRNAQGRIQRVAGVAWDATQLMEARRALEQKTADLVRMDERYRLATHAARVGAWVWNIADCNFEIDESMSAVFGFAARADEYASVRMITMQDFMALLHPDDRERLNQEGVAVLKSDTSEYFQEYRIRLASGEIRGIQSRGSVFRNDAGRAVRAAGVVWDATELLEARRALEHKTQELERANKELDDFSYTASHDLKEPLRGISNYAQYLQEDYATQMDEKGQSMLLKMREQTRRMETLIVELLNVARLSRAPFVIGHADLQATLAEILASLEFSIREGNVEIRIPRPLPGLRCDRVRVGELLRNLITNGLKYNDKPERWIEIGYDGPDSDPVFYVRDNGIGIRPEHRDRVFMLFQRLHTREAFGGGTGVGLTIAQKIAEMHGGRIWINSLPGIGTTFHFTLGKGATG